MPSPISITKAQESYLKTVHLEDIGTRRDDVGEVKLNDIEQALINLAVLFKTTAEKDLQDSMDTGKLAESIQFDKVHFLGGVYSVDINVLDYYKFVNSGVKGLEGGSSSGGFSFKNLSVPKTMLFAIRKWIIRHGLKARNTNPKYRYGTEKKTFGDVARGNALAYAVATSIKKKGLKPTHFWDKAETEVSKQVESILGNAFAISIVNEIAR